MHTGRVIQNFAVLVGAITGAISLAATGYALVRWWKARRVRDRLEISVARLMRQERRLGGVILELDQRLATRSDWAGWARWPMHLGGQLTYASGLADEAEREEALVRALNAQGADERLRQDIEEMHRVLYTVAIGSVDGTVAACRMTHGEPHPVSPGGQEVSPVFTGIDEQTLLEARRRFTTLMRTSLARLGKGDWWSEQRAEGFGSTWTIYRWEGSDVDLATFWGGEVRPLRWD